MNKFWKIVTIVVATVIVVLALYIMANRLGLAPELDFGAGAYFYADIPDYEKYDRVNFSTPWLTALCIVLFLAWGWLMYRLWKWIDRRDNAQENAQDNTQDNTQDNSQDKPQDNSSDE